MTMAVPGPDQSSQNEEKINSVITSRSIQSGYTTARTISWSKNGFIAYAAPTLNNKHNLYLTYLENVDGKSWQLAKKQGISVRPLLESHQCPELSLVSWSNLSTDLAVADIHGNFYVLLAGVGLLDNKESNGSASKTNGSASSDGNGSPSPSYELTSYNHMEMIYRDIIDTHASSKLESISRIISFEWLNILKPQIINKPAVLKNIEGTTNQESAPFAYTYGVSQHHPHGMCHPISTKQACIALRQNGECILYFQGEHKVEYHKISVNLQFSSKSTLITKSSIGFKSDKDIVVCAYDVISDRIKTFLITIDWGFLVKSAQKQKVDPHYHTPKEEQKSPSLFMKTLHEMHPLALNICETGKDEEVNEDIMDIDSDAGTTKSYNIKLGRLSSIDLISPSYDADSKLEILMSYEHEDNAGAMNTSIYRYDLADYSDIVSDAFSDLGTRKNVSASMTDEVEDYTLILQGKLMRSGQVQKIDTAIADSLIVVTYTHGRFDIIDRKSLAIINEQLEGIKKEEDQEGQEDEEEEKKKKKKNTAPATISNMFDVGFNFPTFPNHSKNPMIFAISPNLTSMAYTEVNNEDQQLTLKVVEKVRDNISPKELFLTSVGFAFRHSYACYTNTCTDDLIALIQSEIKRISTLLRNKASDRTHNVDVILNKFVQSIICESHKAINFQLDAFGKESVDKLLSNPPLQKLLSLQLILGELQHEDHIISDIAWIVLNLRSTSFGIMFSLSSIYRQISKKKPIEDSLQDSITRGECIMSLIGNVKWLIDLMIYFNQELLQLAYSKDDPSQSKINLSNSIVLPIILSKVPRLFVIYALSSIGKTHEILKKLNEDLSEYNKVFTPMKEALNRYFTVCSQSPLNLGLFEKFLRESDAFIVKELSQKLSTKEKGYSLKTEQKLVCQGELTEEMIPIAKSVIERHAQNIHRDMKVSELYFYDVDWIDIGIRKSKQQSNNSKFPFHQTPIIREQPNTYKPIVPRLRFSNTECIDALRKIVITARLDKPLTKSNNLPKLRKCTRCRSISLVSDPLVFDAPANLGLWTMVFQRTCICGSAWVNCGN